VGLEVATGRHVVSVAVDPEKTWLSEVMVQTGRTTTVYAGSAPPENPTNRETVSLGSKHIKSLPPVIITQRRLSVPVRLAGPTRVGNVGGPMASGKTVSPVAKKPIQVAKATEPPTKPVEEPMEVEPPSDERADEPMEVDVVPLPIPQEDEALEVVEEDESEPVESPEDNMPMEANDDFESPEENNENDEMDAVPMPLEDSEPEEDFIDEMDEPLADAQEPDDEMDESLSSSNASIVSDETSVAWESVTGWTSIGVGLALVGGAVATSILAMNAADEANGLSPTAPGYQNDFAVLRDQAESQAMWTNILMPTGAALVAAGIALVWLAPDAPATPAVALDETHRLEFQAIPQSGGVLVTTRLDF